MSPTGFLPIRYRYSPFSSTAVGLSRPTYEGPLFDLFRFRLPSVNFTGYFANRAVRDSDSSYVVPLWPFPFTKPRADWREEISLLFGETYGRAIAFTRRNFRAIFPHFRVSFRFFRFRFVDRRRRMRRSTSQQDAWFSPVARESLQR